MARVIIPFLFCSFMLLAGREPPWGDANVSYVTTQALWEHRRLNLELEAPPYFFTVRDGKRYGIGPLGNVVAMIPSHLVHKRLAKVVKLEEQPAAALATHLMPALFMAAAGALFYRVARRRGASPRLALVLTGTLSFATICFVYARVAYSEALQTFALMLLVERALAQAERLTLPGMAGLGVAAGVMLNAKLIYVLVLPLFAGYVVWSHLREPARRDLKRLAVACAVAFAAFLPFLVAALWHNAIKTGSVFRSGHEGQGNFFGGDLWAALHGFLLSPGKSLLLYSPPLLLGLLGLGAALRRRRAETLLLLAVIAVVVFLHAKFRIWHGGYCWGPRYTVPLTPLVLALALPWLPEALRRGRRRLRVAACGALVGAGLFVQFLGGAFYWDHFMRVLVAVKDQTAMARWSDDHLAHGYYVPEFSPLRGHWWLLKHVVRKDPELNRDAPWKGLIGGKIQLKENWDALRADFWGRDWLRGRRHMVRVGVVLLGVFGAGLLASGWGVRRRLRREEREEAAAAATPPATPPAATPPAATPPAATPPAATPAAATPPAA